MSENEWIFLGIGIMLLIIGGWFGATYFSNTGIQVRTDVKVEYSNESFKTQYDTCQKDSDAVKTNNSFLVETANAYRVKAELFNASFELLRGKLFNGNGAILCDKVYTKQTVVNATGNNEIAYVLNISVPAESYCTFDIANPAYNGSASKWKRDCDANSKLEKACDDERCVYCTEDLA